MMELVQAALSGQRRALARLISVMEDDPEAARRVVAEIYPHTGQAHIVGVTGPPGSGKSTLIARMAAEYRRRGSTVGILAVDPTSALSGGALLGDRVRMRSLAGDDGLFVRSMATRGNPGGLARSTGNVARVLDACGYRRILIETVGAGQTDLDIARIAQATVVIQVPDAGDEIQALKAGLLEVASVVVVNKADRPGADRTVAALEAALNPLGGAVTGRDGVEWDPPIIRAVATTGQGTATVVDAIERYVAYLQTTGRGPREERARAEQELRDLLRQELLGGALSRLGERTYEEILDRLAARSIDPYGAARQLLDDVGW